MTTTPKTKVAHVAACLGGLLFLAHCGSGTSGGGTGGAGGAAGTTSSGDSHGTGGTGGTAGTGGKAGSGGLGGGGVGGGGTAGGGTAGGGTAGGGTAGGGTAGGGGVAGGGAAGGGTAGGGTAGGGGKAGSGGVAGSGGTAGSGGNAGAGGTAGSGGVAGTAGAAGSAGGGSGASALQAAELVTTANLNLFTYTHSVDPDSGDQAPIGWGPSTLPSAAQANAATALIRRIAVLLPDSVRNSTNTANAVPGTPSSPSSDVPNPLNGLLTLSAQPSSLFSGTNLAPAASTALEAFRAAAVADAAVAQTPNDPGGLSSTDAADNAKLGGYIAAEAVDPSSAIGIAVNIVTAAVQYGLVTQLKAF